MGILILYFKTRVLQLLILVCNIETYILNDKTMNDWEWKCLHFSSNLLQRPETSSKNN